MNNSEIIIYQNPDGNIKIDVRLEEETVWLTQDQMAILFGKAKSTISEHIKNVFTEGKQQVKIWRRSYDIPPPPMDKSDPNHPTNYPIIKKY